MRDLFEELLSRNEKAATEFWRIPGRIAYAVSHSFPCASDGYAVRTHGIAKALVQSGYSVIAINQPGRPWDFPGFATPDFRAHQNIDGVQYVFSKHPGKKNLDSAEYAVAATKAYQEMFRVFKPGAVLAASNWESALPAAVAATRLGLPFYYDVRGFWELSRVAREPEWRDTDDFKATVKNESLIAMAADRVFTINRFMADELIARGVQPEKISLIPNGYDSPTTTREEVPGITKETLGCDTRYVVGYVGSFNAYEGLETLIRACAQLRDEGCDLSLLLVGSSSQMAHGKTCPQTGKYRKIAKELGLGRHLITPGRANGSKLISMYNLIDLVVLPREPFDVCRLVSPIKPLEAGMLEKPLLTSDVPPLKEFVEASGGGEFFPAGNAEALSQKIRKMLGDQTTLKQYGYKAREWVLTQRTWQACIASMLPVINEATAENNTQISGIQSGTQDASPGPAAKIDSHHSATSCLSSLPSRSMIKKIAPNGDQTLLKVAGILDEFTSTFLEKDVWLLSPRPDNWEAQMKMHRPDFFFVESCWRGNDNAWGTLTKGSGGGGKLSPILRWCSKNGVPTVFWNKEDPPHFEKFAPVAKGFDYVFTTDVNMVQRYWNEHGIDAMPLPFGAQPAIHNPSPVGPRVPRAVFAGSYYRDKPERCADFDNLFRSIDAAGLKYDIYDRCFHREMDRFKFTDQYLPSIVGYLPPEEMWKAHKGYKYQINMNTIRNSSTMFARRVYESLASGTPVISNYSKGVEEMFGNIVAMSESGRSVVAQIRRMENEPDYYEEIVDQGVREVLRHHTYAHRLKRICDRIGLWTRLIIPSVTAVFAASSIQDVERAQKIFDAQSYKNKKLLIILKRFDGAYEWLNRSTPEAQFVLDFALESAELNALCESDHVVELDTSAVLHSQYLEDFVYSKTGGTP